MVTTDSEETIVLDPRDLPGQGSAHLLNAVVAPRPIAWVSTVSAAGVANVAPHSYFTVSRPACSSAALRSPMAISALFMAYRARFLPPWISRAMRVR